MRLRLTMSLRARLLIVLVTLAAVGLVAVGAVTYVFLDRSLTERADQQLLDARDPVARLLGGGPPGRITLPPGTYAEGRDASGNIEAGPIVFTLRGESSNSDKPRLPAALPDVGATGGAVFLTTSAQEGPTRFRVGVFPFLGGSLVVAIPLTDADATLSQLLIVEAGVSLAVLALLVGLAWWLVRLGLRPLARMGDTAGAIAAGDLSRRVAPTDERTEVGRLGIALNAMLGQIEQAVRRRAASEDRLRRFIADASHELRTPLTSIRGYAELFRRGAGDRPQDLTTTMRRIEEESARMGRLVDDLLLLARLDEGRPLDLGPVDLTALASDAVADARAVDPARPITLHSAATVPVLGDESRLRQVIANLVGNALAHTPPATPVEVRVEPVEGTAVLTVADRGPGLPEGNEQRVFERFYRADPSRARQRGGTGLGLSIVAALVAAHGGRVAAGPTPGGGATFRVELPLRQPAHTPPERPAPVVPAPPG